MREDFDHDEKKWLIVVGVLVLVLLLVATYQFWPEALRVFAWPG
ncbi:MAG TPA: hypothetical protein PLR32_08120 [candidate division Zixibacteria bacterium]|nr:hypothetical protein [candidate division Zixibacteria bacterium]MDM7974110.1 hypothetical protein [candidate division Zixibacteria bacterium]HOD66873.1 hypothetical protein [candidate division Zixibacteria bacterium]HOZ08106.1 hypothetical protein [candidate division Zixibacteria bacterium]HPI33266.1 hypothetical protein [candidate division Zixibacteria bacterium]